MSANDYYPFGSAMAGRKYNQGTYRYGFNGKEEDKEWGSQMIQDYGFRIYNPTIGKFLSVDPLAKEYPELTTYQFASNTPIQAIDLDGLEGVKYYNHEDKTLIIRSNQYYINNKNKELSKLPFGSFSKSEIETFKKGINEKLEERTFYEVVNLEGEFSVYEVKFEINFIELESVESMSKFGSNDILSPDALLSKINEVIIDEGGYGTGTSRRRGAANWRLTKVSDVSNAHTNTHELFHQFTHKHLNASEEVRTQIDEKNQIPGHTEAGGIFMYEDVDNGTELEGLSQKNVDMAIETVPEKSELNVVKNSFWNTKKKI